MTILKLFYIREELVDFIIKTIMKTFRECHTHSLLSISDTERQSERIETCTALDTIKQMAHLFLREMTINLKWTEQCMSNILNSIKHL